MLMSIYCSDLIVKVQNVTHSSNHQNTSKCEDGGTMASGKFCDSKCLSLPNQSV